jgi:S1-C subfamily serine protease
MPVAIHTTCPECQAPLALADELAGKKIRCSKCREPFVVPDSPEEEDQPRQRVRAAPPGRTAIRAAEDERPARRRAAEERKPQRRERTADGPRLMPWLIGGGMVLFCLLLVGGVVITLVIMNRQAKDDQAGNDAVSWPKVVGEVVEKPEVMPAEFTKPLVIVPAPAMPAAVVVDPPVVAASGAGPATTARPPGKRGELSGEARDQVKRATVLLRVTMANDEVGSGSGFFGAPDSPSLLLTNAHVVGMLSPDSHPPKSIDVFVNSGQEDEKRLSARVVGVDRSSDLAVLDVGSKAGLPRPLTVKSANALRELDKVYIFGFPLGEQLGKEITIRPSSVSSLRKKGGVLDKIQVAGGMDPGNSGGPVVDESGDVVGVAVSGIQGLLINFAIPGERVHGALAGRIAEMGIGQPFRNGDRVSMPVTIVMIDPRGRIKEVGLEVWTGLPKAPAPAPGNATPRALPGDSPRKRHLLSYAGGTGRAEVTLPPLPPGKVYWVQPVWTLASGATYWAAGHIHRLGPPLERKSIELKGVYTSAGARRVDITTSNSLRVAAGTETEAVSMNASATLAETGTAKTDGVTLRLGYQSLNQVLRQGGAASENPKLATVRPHLSRLAGLVELDSAGQLRTNSVADVSKLRNDQIGTDLLEVHQPIQHALYSLLLPMPNRTIKARDSWKFRRYVAVGPPMRVQRVEVELTCTYQGVRRQAGREEAVLTLDGQLRNAQMGGRARGLAVVDVATGVVRRVELKVEADLPTVEMQIGENNQKLRLLSILGLRLERAL